MPDEQIKPIAAGLNKELQKHILELLDEQKYTKLKTILQDLRNIYTKVAANLGIFIDQMEESIQAQGQFRCFYVQNHQADFVLREQCLKR